MSRTVTPPSWASILQLRRPECSPTGDRLNEGELSSDAFAEVRGYKRKIDRRLRAFIQEGIQDGSIAPCDAKIAAFSIAGAVNWICMWYEPRGALSAEEIASQFARTLTYGMANSKVSKPTRRPRQE